MVIMWYKRKAKVGMMLKISSKAPEASQETWNRLPLTASDGTNPTDTMI